MTFWLQGSLLLAFGLGAIYWAIFHAIESDDLGFPLIEMVVLVAGLLNEWVALDLLPLR